ncbi:pathogenesis-related protein 1-like [Oryza glaberrima]|uniref:pathogenesis-related protein 1-like n=1 Tax=Oryza glaberrima TaxID=4538 RepID=UPI00224C2B18|nr:pathogenesis-related protein 1-like [Oryza glaberrima]
MSSSFSCLAILSLLALASHLPDAASAPRGIGPLSPAAAAKLVSAVNDARRGPTEGRCDVANANLDPTFRVLRKPIVAMTYFVTGGGPGRRRAADAVGAWAEGRRWYDAGANRCVAGGGEECASYKDMVQPAWKTVGCAVAPCASGQTLTICVFSPAG